MLEVPTECVSYHVLYGGGILSEPQLAGAHGRTHGVDERVRKGFGGGYGAALPPHGGEPRGFEGRPRAMVREGCVR